MKKLNATLLIILVGVLPATPVWAKNLAGFVIVSVGDVTAFDTDKQKARNLKRRSKIFEGDEIRTGESAKVQLKFKDKGVISLQENTSLQITEFAYTGKEGDPERSFFKLVKGGFRAISGAIGKQNPEDYRVDTPLATIGIRGTHYQVETGARLAVSVSSGKVEVRNSGGRITIGDNQNYRYAVVNGEGQMPVGSMEPVKVLEPESLNIDTEEDSGDEELGETEGTAEEEPLRNEDLTDEKVITTEENAPPELAPEVHGELDLEPEDNASSDDTTEDTVEDTQQATNESTTIDPVITDSGATDPGTTDPGTTDPGTTSGDPRLTDAEASELGPYWGLATESTQPVSTDPSTGFVGGWARDGNLSPGLFVDKGVDPNDPNYSTLPIDVVLRQGTHTNSQTNFARYDAGISTATSGMAWGRWSGGTAELYTDPNDASVFTPISNDIYWITARPSFTLPTSSEVHFKHSFLLAGVGSAGSIIDDDPASVNIQFTVDWQTMTFYNGEFRIKTGVANDPSTQSNWSFTNLSGSFIDTNNNQTPVLEFDALPVGEVCVGACTATATAEGEIRAIVLEGNNQIGGNFTFWEQGNTAEWVTGVFAVGAEERYTSTEAQSLSQGFFGVFQRHPNDSGALTSSALMRGKSQTPTTGDFLMVDFLEQDYGTVIRLGAGVVETVDPGASAAIHGHTVEWGAWNGASVETDFTGGSAGFETERYSWITYSPIDAALMDTLTAQVSFSLPYAFYGWQYNSADGTQEPLQLQHGYINVDLANDTLDGGMVFYGLGRFDVNFSGSTIGDGITVESSSAFYNGLSVSISMDGQYIGSTFADGLVGGFKISDPGDLNLFASGVFGFGRDERISSTQIGTMNQVGFMSIDAQDVSFPEVKAGIANTPTSGLFTFRTFDAVNSEVYEPVLTSPIFNNAMVGTIPVDWGAWDDPAGTAAVLTNPLDGSSSTVVNDNIAWVVSTPSDPADIPTTGVTAYNTIVGFIGYENGLPINTPNTGDITMSVDFANQTFDATMNLAASTNTWSMSYSGAIDSSKISATGTGVYNGSQAASGVINGTFVGTGSTSAGAGPEGIIGAFKNQVDADPTIHSSGVFVMQQ